MRTFEVTDARMRAGFESLHDKLDALIRRIGQKIEPVLDARTPALGSRTPARAVAEVDSPAPVQVY
jgi:hypothetical protein